MTQQSVYGLLTGCSQYAAEEVRDLSEVDLTHLYEMAAFGHSEDPVLHRRARDGILFEQLRRIYLQQTTGRSSSVVLKAALNAFFCTERAWATSGGDRANLTQSLVDEISRLAEVDERRWGVRVANLMVHAAMAHVSRQHNECARFLCEVTSCDSPEDPVIECHYGAFTYRPPVQETYEALGAKVFQRANISFHTTSNEVRVPTTLCVADPEYFKIYAPEFVSSSARFGTQSMHFHIVNPDEECFTLFERMQMDFRDQVLGLSSETFPGATKAHYASLRFMRLAEILEFLKVDIYVLDIDVSFSRPPEVIWSTFRNHDCALLRRDGYPAYLPWRSVGAGVALFKWSDRGRECADIVSRCINYLWAVYAGDSERCWWIDQNALFLASELLEARSIDTGIVPSSVVGQLNHTYAEKQRTLMLYKRQGILDA